jgi:hypothetical protein
MTSLATAKILLVIALSSAPANPSVILATSGSENYAWTHTDSGWSLRTKGLPSGVWFSKDDQPAPENRSLPALEAIHGRTNAFVNLQDNAWVEKQNGATFYILDPGAPNEKIFTILYPTK